MRKYKIVFDPIVQIELQDYFAFIASENIVAASNWLEGILSAIETLDLNPNRCPFAVENEFHDFEIRHLIFGNYRVIFRVMESEVQILHIRHAKMKPQIL